MAVGRRRTRRRGEQSIGVCASAVGAGVLAAVLDRWGGCRLPTLAISGRRPGPLLATPGTGHRDQDQTASAREEGNERAWGVSATASSEGGRAPHTVRVVALSDTHGFEAMLRPEQVPEGDILVHCGDFCWDGGHAVSMAGLERFDAWLGTVAKQRFGGQPPVVVRGNHDMYVGGSAVLRGGDDYAILPVSGALFFGWRPAMLDVLGGALRVAVVPWMERRKMPRQVELPEGPDILLSHVPPHGVHDRTLDGLHVGSVRLRDAVAALKRRPKVWFFGHIHEGFGATWQGLEEGAGPSVENSEQVLCANVAMANDGRAKLLKRPPTVVDIEIGTQGALAARCVSAEQH
mmetsp:Transcript_93547/g.260481  ORF Transcript_93547/g.260481 Transcript_93547/m.260481 type:complete len:347 (+) Transcript_93547:89-1129(+)